MISHLFGLLLAYLGLRLCSVGYKIKSQACLEQVLSDGITKKVSRCCNRMEIISRIIE